ncbi:MAG: glycogen debranching protein, partial [Candidatus Aminicenantes bacterium]|nr:glycogen debranching protein [Candidatus Aminicenantes bacterium]
GTVIAGYPWFTEWGRDTMIALPGLTLATRRCDDAREILRTFSRFVDRGMIPNVFPDGGQPPEFNSADGTLWFVVALYKYLDNTGDLAFIGEMFSRLGEIVTEHLKGTRYGIRVDTDGLLVAGEPGTQLTWMDAKVGDWVVTPRVGKPVEVNALWINVLFILREFARRLKKDPPEAIDPLEARREFIRQFWNPETKCLFDVVDGRNKDASIRPNQIFAAALPFPLLSRTRARYMLACVRRTLMTPLGLRTLDPGHQDYKPCYRGNPLERDSAYHQGTAWPWLIGPYLQAYAYAHGKPRLTERVLRGHIAPLFRHLSEAGLGHISEVADGDVPHTPGGCFAQAWSAGTLLEVLDLFEPLTRQ